jgi:asparagine synthase (glutamine-hydrolysing)
MCGINGILIPEQASGYADQVRKMNEVLRHRGPDDQGVYEDENLQLGHCRLSIIDLSERGHQPMSDKDKTIWLSCNGEIYNYKEIRQTLLERGHTFNSESDSEVIIHGFKEWGVEIFQKLEGMFAFVLWDKVNKVLHMVRDACGVKPLFYYFDGKTLVFSSEIKGLLASGLVERKVDIQSLSNFLSLAYIPNPDTILNNVYQVPPGTFLSLMPHGSIKETRFWRLGENRPQIAKTPHELNEQIREEVSLAVRNSIVSDVPVSLLLSSGVDSAIILKELKNIGRTEIETLTIGFEDPSYDESGIAKKLADEYGFSNQSYRMCKTEAPKIIEKIIYHLDFLNANPCIIAEYLNFEKVSKKFHVALMGTGNDELFAGYLTHVANNFRQYYGVVPLFLRKLIYEIASKLPVSEKKYSFDYFAYKFAQGSLFPRKKSHYWWRTMFSEEDKISLMQNDLLSEKNLNLDAFYIYEKYFNETEGKLSFQDQTLYTDFHIFLVDNGNMEVDQLSMAFSIEARPPFLTKRFADFAFSIPFDKKLKGMKTKSCLREAYDNHLPNYILKRKKQGLVSPLDFLFKKEMNDFVSSHLLSEKMSEFFNLEYIETLIKKQRNNEENNSYRLFTLLCFSIWQDLFLTS